MTASFGQEHSGGMVKKKTWLEVVEGNGERGTEESIGSFFLRKINRKKGQGEALAVFKIFKNYSFFCILIRLEEGKFDHIGDRVDLLDLPLQLTD